MSARWINVVMANGTPDVAVRDDERVDAIVKERQRYYDELAANIAHCPVEEVASRGLRKVFCTALPVMIVDEKDTAYTA